MSQSTQSIKRFPNFRGFRIQEVYVITVLEGLGVEDDPYREVEYWFDRTGKHLFKRDPAEHKKVEGTL